MKLIKISAIWCSACLITNPNFDAVLKDYPNIEVIEYDYDIDEDIVKKYEVGNIIPVIIFLKDNKEIDRIIGEKNKKEIKEFIEKNIK